MQHAIEYEPPIGVGQVMSTTWVILGATSIIAAEFAHLAANAGHNLILVGRDTLQLDVISDDLSLRYPIHCEVITADFSEDFTALTDILRTEKKDFSLFVAHSFILENNQINADNIKTLVKTNILSTVEMIHAYLQKPQSFHQLVFLSSVAACKGRSKNSLYGGSKAAVDTYLQGLQQAASKSISITIARLGFIDTAQTYGLPGIFYASPPKKCAKACWKATQSGRRLIYHPFFWRLIMGIVVRLPFFLYKRMGNR